MDQNYNKSNAQLMEPTKIRTLRSGSVYFQLLSHKPKMIMSGQKSKFKALDLKSFILILDVNFLNKESLDKYYYN